MRGDFPTGCERASRTRRSCVPKAPKVATRKAAEMALDPLIAALPELLGGSADLTRLEQHPHQRPRRVRPEDFAGRYMHYGVREHGMAAAMNGIALHGGLIPYGGTFLVFSDYCRAAIRLAALMAAGVYVITHDSIGLGEDGPTHQPVEHLAALRAIPEPQRHPSRPTRSRPRKAWEIALPAAAAPTALCPARQAVPILRTKPAPKT